MSLPCYAKIHLRSSLLTACLGLCAASAAADAPARIALVLGNSEYYSLPATPSCTASMRLVSDALAGLGYRVVERGDGTSGGIGAAMGKFQSAIEDHPGASAVAYFCGHAAALDQRIFVLPVSASLVRPSDVRTQGILAKAFLDLMQRGRTSRALVLMDLDSRESLSQEALNVLARIETDAGTGLIAVVGSLDKESATLLASTLAEKLAAPDVATVPLLRGLDSKLSKSTDTRIGAMHLPLTSLALAEEDPLHPPKAQTPGPTPVILEPPPAAAAPQPVVVPPSVEPSFPDEAAMTPEQRRMVQIGLARFGYYGGRIDSVFGPETRAAIRQYQGEIRAEVTGIITGEQARRLLTVP